MTAKIKELLRSNIPLPEEFYIHSSQLFWDDILYLTFYLNLKKGISVTTIP